MNIHNFGNETDKPFHSHAYVDVGNGGSIGSTNSQSFGQRYSVERNRRAVRSYRDSHIGRGSLSHQARRGVMDPFGRLDASAISSTRKQDGTTPASPTINPRIDTPARPAFKEPPTRGYNPYA